MNQKKTLSWVFSAGKNDRIEVYKQTAGSINKEVARYLVKKSEKTLQQGGGYFVPVSLNASEKATLYVRIQEILHENPEVDFEFVSQAEYVKRIDNKKGWDYIFLGIVLIMMLYSLMVFTGSGVRTNLYCAMYLLSLGIIFVFITGVLREEIIGEHPEYTRFGMLSVPATAAFYFLFIYSFLDIKHLIPVWARWFKVLVKINLSFIL